MEAEPGSTAAMEDGVVAYGLSTALSSSLTCRNSHVRQKCSRTAYPSGEQRPERFQEPSCQMLLSNSVYWYFYSVPLTLSPHLFEMMAT